MNCNNSFSLAGSDIADPRRISFRTFLQISSVIRSCQYLSDDDQSVVLSSFIGNQISMGNIDFLDRNCPKTEKFIEAYQVIMANSRPDERQNLLAKLTKGFLKETRLFENPGVQVQQTGASSEGKNTTNMCTSNGTSQMRSTVGQLNAHQNAIARIPGPVWNQEITHRQEYESLAEALDSLGPCVLTTRTGLTGPLVPQNWSATEYRCCTPNCFVRWLVSSPGKSLSSSPAFVFSQRQQNHMGHDAVTWADWYAHKVTCNKRSTKWDDHRYKKQPGLPPTFALFVEQFVLRSPASKPMDCYRQLEKAQGENPVLANCAQQRELIREQVKTLHRSAKQKKHATCKE